MGGMNNLEKLKYFELRKIAKAAGIRANLKQEKLLKLLQEHYQKSEISTPGTPVSLKEQKCPGIDQTVEAELTPKENLHNIVKENSSSHFKHSSDVQVLSNTPVIVSHRKSSNQLKSTKDGTPDVSTAEQCSANDSSGEVTFKTSGRKRKRSGSCNNSDCKSSNGMSSKIPRLERADKSNERELKKKVKTPDWKKIHKKTFSQFESIDDYMNRKNKRAEVISNSLKKVKKIVDETNAAVKKLKDNKTPVLSKVGSSSSAIKKASPFKPTVLSTKEARFNFNKKNTVLTKSSFRAPSQNDSHLKPSVTSETKKVNNMITPKTHRDESTRKSSVVSRSDSKGTRGSLPSTQTKSTVSSLIQNQTFSHSKPSKPCNTQMKTENSAKKVFDLKSSLAKPLSWKPHKGKLKPLDMNCTIYKSNNPTQRIERGRQQEKMSLMKRRQEKKFEKQMEKRDIHKRK